MKKEIIFVKNHIASNWQIMMMMTKTSRITSSIFERLSGNLYTGFMLFVLWIEKFRKSNIWLCFEVGWVRVKSPTRSIPVKSLRVNVLVSWSYYAVFNTLWMKPIYSSSKLYCNAVKLYISSCSVFTSVFSFILCSKCYWWHLNDLDK